MRKLIVALLRRRLTAITVCTALSLLSYTVFAEEVRSITVRGKPIGLGDTADYVFSILQNSDMVGQKISRNQNGLVLAKDYRVDAKSFTITFARVSDPGPYVVLKIVLIK